MGFRGVGLRSALWAESPGDALLGGGRDALLAALLTLPVLTLPSRRWAVLAGRLLVGGMAAIVALTWISVVTDGPP